ncbi:helix-turn-helix domain-containing protein [Streptomyces sp. NPDC049813]|uniref:helix-turn-helix domain-containing protein n=1 Tax=Streptomyces sp. NPDC049813 TaxID=3365597 RepID=UPI0037A5340C
MTQPPPAEAVVPLLRGLDVLRRLTDADGTLALAELARTTGLARSTADRICATLAHLGYVRLDGRDASLAPPLMAVANACLDALRVPALLAPLADRLADDLDESVSLAVPDGPDIRFVHQVLRRRALSISFRVGDSLPGEGSAPGLVFRDGGPLAVDDQLVEPGLIAVAAPVRGPAGGVVCAVSVVSHTSRHGVSSLRDAVRGPLVECVAAMEEVLAAPPQATGLRPGPRSSNAGGADMGAEPSRMGGASPPETTGLRPGPRSSDAGGTDKGSAGGAGAGDIVVSLARGLKVLLAFDGAPDGLTLSEVAERAGLARATARRALLTYEFAGYVVRESRTYRLTPRVLALGCAPLSRTTLPRIAAPHLAALSAAVGESVGLSVADGDRVRCTARVTPRRVMSVDIGVGSRLPAATTAAGRVLEGAPDGPTPDGSAPGESAPETSGPGVSAPDRPAPETSAPDESEPDRPAPGKSAPDGPAPDTSAPGVSGVVVLDGPEDGLWGLAVPVRDRAGRVVCALDVTAHQGRGSARAWSGALAETAAAITADLHVTSRFVPVPAG